MKARRRKYVYHYLTVQFPPDLEERQSDLMDLAIEEARERMRTCRFPAEWTATRLAPHVYRVCRKAYALTLVKVYSVVENMRGYLPDSEPFWTRSRRAAESYAADLARQARDDGYTVSGSAREGYDVDNPESETDLGRVITMDVLEIDRGDWADYQRENNR